MISTVSTFILMCSAGAQHFWKKGFHVNVKTNNGVEALNSLLKRSYLRPSGNMGEFSIATTIRVMVREFLPEMFREYKEENFKASSENAKYNQSIPSFFHDRPHQLLKHWRTRWDASAYSPLIEGANPYYVASESSETTYTVKLGDAETYPSCSCVDFSKHFLLCKHFFALIRQGCIHWEDISALYRNSLYINIDWDVLQTKQPIKEDKTFVSINYNTCIAFFLVICVSGTVG